MSDRDSAISAFYAKEAPGLVRAVMHAVDASPLTVEDACAYAWCQLVRRADDIRLGRSAFWWLYRVAVREAWKLSAVDCRHVPRGDGAEVACGVIDAATPVDDLVEHRDELRSLRTLPERQRRILLLHALGFTYAEIGRMTGDSARTVERLLRRSKETLRASPGGTLSRRELEVIDGLAAGRSARTIAEDLGLGASTVEDYIARAYRKLGVSTRSEALTAYAARL